MRAHKVDLQLANLVTHDAHIAKFSNPGSNGVSKFVPRDQRVNHSPRPANRFARIGR